MNRIASWSSKAAAAKVAALLVAAILAIVIGRAITSNDTDSPDTEPEWVSVIVKSRLISGTPFQVSYQPKDPADAERLQPSVALELRRNGEAINTLLAVGSDKVQPPGKVAIPAVALRGTGPFDLTLPKVAAGDYQLCGPLWFMVGPGPQDTEKVTFCRTIQVTAR